MTRTNPHWTWIVPALAWAPSLAFAFALALAGLPAGARADSAGRVPADTSSVHIYLSREPSRPERFAGRSPTPRATAARPASPPDAAREPTPTSPSLPPPLDDAELTSTPASRSGLLIAAIVAAAAIAAAAVAFARNA